MVATHIEKARANRAAVLELMGRFVDLSRTQIASLLFDGNVRNANRVLLSLTKAKRLHRYAVELRGEYIYSLRKGPTGQTDHNLTITELYARLHRENQKIWGSGNVKLNDELITDLLVVADDLAIVTEVHRATNSFGTKLAKYASWKDGQMPPWYKKGMKIVVWIVAPIASVPWLERQAAQYREGVLRHVVVSSLPDAVRNPWRALGEAPIRWKIPK